MHGCLCMYLCLYCSAGCLQCRWVGWFGLGAYTAVPRSWLRSPVEHDMYFGSLPAWSLHLPHVLIALFDVSSSLYQGEAARPIIAAVLPAVGLQVASFPAHMVGEPVSAVAVYLQEMYDAILIAAAGSAPAEHASQPTEPRAAAIAAESAATATASPATAASALAEMQPAVQLAPLQHTITAKTSAYVIASDLRVVLDIMEAPAEEYTTWKADQQEAEVVEGVAVGREKQEQLNMLHGLRLQFPEGRSVSPDESYSTSPLAAAVPAESEATAEDVKQPALLQSADVLSSPECEQLQREPFAHSFSIDSPDRHVMHQSFTTSEQVTSAASPQGTLSLATVSAMVSWNSSEDRSAMRQARRTEGEVQAGTGGTSKAAALFSTTAKSLLATGNIHSATAAAPGHATGVHEAGAAAKRRHRGSIHVNTRPNPATRHLGGKCYTGCCIASVCVSAPHCQCRNTKDVAWAAVQVAVGNTHCCRTVHPVSACLSTPPLLEHVCVWSAEVCSRPGRSSSPTDAISCLQMLR